MEDATARGGSWDLCQDQTKMGEFLMGIWRDSRRRLGWGRGGVINDNQEGGARRRQQGKASTGRREVHNERGSE